MQEWADHFDLAIAPLREDRSDPTTALTAVWARLREVIWGRLARPASTRLRDYGNMQARKGLEDGLWSASADRLHLFFSDEQGNANVSFPALAHWSALACADAHDSIRAELERHGYALQTPRLDVAATVWSRVSAPLIEFDGQLCMLVAARRWERRADREWLLESDICGPSDRDLEPEEVTQLEASWAERRCQCEYCQQLRETTEDPG